MNVIWLSTSNIEADISFKFVVSIISFILKVCVMFCRSLFEKTYGDGIAWVAEFTADCIFRRVSWMRF